MTLKARFPRASCDIVTSLGLNDPQMNPLLAPVGLPPGCCVYPSSPQLPSAPRLGSNAFPAVSEWRRGLAWERDASLHSVQATLQEKGNTELSGCFLCKKTVPHKAFVFATTL